MSSPRHSLIPVDLLFGNPDKTAAQLSPGGAYLAYLAPDEGVLNVWVQTAGSDDDRAITRDRRRGIRMYTWAFDGRRLLYLQDLDGDENWHIWSVDMQSGAIRDLTPFLGVQAHLVAADPGFPNQILVAMNLRDARAHDVYRADLETGALTLEVENPGNVVHWAADAQFVVRAAQAATPDGGFDLRVRQSHSQDWHPILHWGPDEEGHIYQFADDGRLYIGSTLGSDTVELRLLDIQTGKEETLASNPEVDLSNVLSHPREHRIQAAAFNKDRLAWLPLDDEVSGDLSFLQSQKDGEVTIASRTLADDRWIALYMLDRSPSVYCLYDRPDRRLQELFLTRPALQQYSLAEMRPISFEASDGLRLHGYLSLPPGVEPRGLPMVLNVHGGPWARDFWGFDAEAQWLANRGYACLQINFRGSTGFGKKFLHAGDREWGARMHQDLLDGVDWAIAQGYADRSRVGIFGASYGGYAALVGAAFTPGVFACAVDIVGPSSILTLIESIPPYWEPLKRIFTVRVGDPETETEFLKSRSPLYRADQIQCPMLIAQGANDPRVKQAESERIVEELRKRGKEVEYLLFDDEGHGFARPENRLKFYGAAERFLARYLGGRVEYSEKAPEDEERSRTA